MDFVSGFGGRGELAKAILDNDIIRAGLAITNVEDHTYALKHLIISHAKVMRLAQACPQDRIEDARKALGRIGYHYQYIFDLGLFELGQTTDKPDPKDYGPLAHITATLFYPTRVDCFLSNICTCCFDAIRFQAKEEMIYMLTARGLYDSAPSDTVVMYDAQIRDMVGYDTVKRFWMRIIQKHGIFYHWLNGRPEIIATYVRQYVDFPKLLRAKQSKMGDLKDQNTGCCYTHLNLNVRMEIRAEPPCVDLIEMFSMPVNHDIENTLTAPYIALYDQMPNSFKELDLVGIYLVSALEVFYYHRDHPIIANYLKYHNIDLSLVDALVESPKVGRLRWNVDDMVEQPIVNPTHLPDYHALIGWDSCITQHYVIVGGKHIPHKGEGIVTVNLMDTVFRCPGQITVDFDKCICIRPNINGD